MRGHGVDHGVGFFEGAGEGFFDEDVDVVWGDFFDPGAVLGGGGAEDDDIGFGGFDAGVGVGECWESGGAEFLDGVVHAFGFFVADADKLGVGVLGGHAEEVAHVEVVEVDACDAPDPFCHRG